MKGIYILLMIVIFTSCKTTKNTKKEMALQKSYKVIKLLRVDDLAVNPTVNFDLENKKIAGFAGCNRYSTDFTLKNDLLKLGNPLATKMYCTNMNIEKKFFEYLAKVNHIKIENKKLSFLDVSNNVLMEAIPINHN